MQNMFSFYKLHQLYDVETQNTANGTLLLNANCSTLNNLCNTGTVWSVASSLPEELRHNLDKHSSL